MYMWQRARAQIQCKYYHRSAEGQHKVHQMQNGIHYLCLLSACESAALRAPKAAVACVCSHQVLRPEHRKVSRILLTTALAFAASGNILYVLHS